MKPELNPPKLILSRTTALSQGGLLLGTEWTLSAPNGRTWEWLAWEEDKNREEEETPQERPDG